MSWSLNIAGHIAEEIAEDLGTTAKALEEELVARIREAVSDSKFGATASSFGGSHVTANDVHEPVAAESAADPADIAHDTGAAPQ